MIAKFSIAGIVVLAAVLLLALWRSVETIKSQDFTIETVGLSELDIHLEAPYGKESPYHALIVNNSSHNLIACEILFELITHDGRILPGRRIVAYEDLLQATSVARPSLLKLQPGIAPHTKMLIGMGVEPELIQVFDQLPPLGKSQTEIVLNESIRIKKLVITLDAVVIENGEALGPKGDEFLVYLKESVLKERP